jgi:hypothetical protein
MEEKAVKINWVQKLSSRKFWAAAAAYLTSVLTAFNVTENVVAQVSIVIAGIGSLAVYMLAEAQVDSRRAEGGGTDGAE